MRILLIAYDNGSHISYFPLGLAYIASVCRDAGHDVMIYNQDIYHWPEEHLSNLLGKERFDAVGVGVIGGYYQYKKILKISEAINKSKQRPFYILGGHGPSPEPEYFLRKTSADAVVIGEGEVTVIKLLNAISARKDLSLVDGIAFIDRKTNEFVRTKRRELIHDVDGILLPAWDIFPMEHYALFAPYSIKKKDRSMIMISGRGCNFKCNFCYRMDKGLRIRSAESIIQEMKILKNKYSISNIAFFDELLMNSVKRVSRLCKRMIDADLNMTWGCNGRLNYADKELLKLMRQAGCTFINYGIESIDDNALRIMGKGLTVKQITEGVENTLYAGISPGLNIIFGNISETAEILQKDVEFLLKYDDHVQLRTIRPVTPYPGSPLYYHALQKGLLGGPEDFYERKHLNSDLISVNFTDMSDKEVHRLLFEANKILIERYHSDKQRDMIESARKLYIESDTSFRGFR